MISYAKERNEWLDIALLKPSEYSEKQINNKNKKKDKIEKNVPIDISWWTWKGGPPTKK